MGLSDWFRPTRGRCARAAQAKELAGDLGSAAELYRDAGLGDEAARVLLLRADACPTAEGRIAFCGAAAAVAASDAVRKKAASRRAILALDVLASGQKTILQTDAIGLARDLEDAGDHLNASTAYALAGDTEAETRMLVAAGAIERLEARLAESLKRDRAEGARDEALQQIRFLDSIGERRAALEAASAALPVNSDGPIRDLVQAIRRRVVKGPLVDLEIDGERRRYALGVEVTIGRSDATIAVTSPAVSRRHLVLRRRPTGDITVEDLATANGTLLAGSRLRGEVPVGAGLHLVMAGQVPCSIIPEGGLCRVEVGGEAYALALGDVAAGPWHVRWVPEGFVALARSTSAPPAFLGNYEVGPVVELCVGDAIRDGRGGPVRVLVPESGAARAAADEGSFR